VLVADGSGGAVVVVGDARDTLQSDLYATFLRADLSQPRRVANFGAHVERGRVSLTWAGGVAPDPIARVVRRAGPDPGVEVATVTLANGSDGPEWRYVDTDVERGGFYGYVLRYVDGGLADESAEVAVDVPTSLEFGLKLEANPIGDDLVVTLTLPERSEARLDLYDVAGRRVRSMRLANPGPLRTTVALDPERSLHSGVYFARVSQNGHTAGARVVVIR
jgi:hypothetical protein